MAMRRKSFPLAYCWHNKLWRAWDRLTPAERSSYEQSYEANQTKGSLQRLRGHLARAQGSRKYLHAKRIQPLLAAVMLATPAHLWYPKSCCGGQDCHPTPCENITPVPDGWI